MVLFTIKLIVTLIQISIIFYYKHTHFQHTKNKLNNPLTLTKRAIQTLSIIPIYIDNVDKTLLKNKEGIKQDPLYQVQESCQDLTVNQISKDTCGDVPEGGSKDISVDVDIKSEVCSDDEVLHTECIEVKAESFVKERKTSSETESENELVSCFCLSFNSFQGNHSNTL